MLSRIIHILKVKNISASKFADDIGVQRSSISHILSERNKPSLELVQKILKKYPDISANWLISGEGSIYTEPDLFSQNTDIEIKASVNEIPISVSAEENLIEQNFSENHLTAGELHKTKLDENESDILKLEDQKPKSDEILTEVKTSQQNVNQVSANVQIKNEILKTSGQKEIERIIIFYSDKTFIEYKPE